MKRLNILIFGILSLLIITILYFIYNFINFNSIKNIIIGIIYFILFAFSINEFINWYKKASRGESFDFIILGYLFITVYIFTQDIFNSFIGALSVYLFFGIIELKEYEVLNKILLITLITYNFIFFAGLINSYLKSINIINTDIIRDTAFSMSFWIILILGFILFGRKYLVVFRFISPQYLSLLLFLIAWLAVTYISRNFIDIKNWIYIILILTNWVIYFFSGPLLDIMLGIKRTNNELLIKIVKDVKERLNIKEKIRVGFGKYPILNAMAYGAWFDKRIAIISPDISSFPEDELKGIVGHELSHTKGGFKNIPDTLILTIISSIELLIFWILKWPATIYDYTFNPESQPFPIWVFLIINIGISIILYIFIRALESFADLNTKKVKLEYELTKGLYNLEGFYSSSREIGLDTILLCEEKLKDYNRIANYANTAQYLYENMIIPKRYILLSNLLNSHPPSFHRIVSILNEGLYKLNPVEEAILPFKLLRKKNQLKFFLKYCNSIFKFKDLANKRFKEMFGIENYSEYLKKLEKQELFKNYLNKIILFIHKFKPEFGIGKITRILLNDNICFPISFEIIPINLEILKTITKEIDLKNLNKQKDFQNSIENLRKLFLDFSKKMEEKLVIINPFEYEINLLEIEGKYIDKNNSVLELLGVLSYYNNISNYQIEFEKCISLKPNVKLNDYIKEYYKFIKSIKKNNYYIFQNTKSNLFIVKRIKFNLKFNLNNIKNSVGKIIYLIEKNTLKLLILSNFIEKENLKESYLICKDYNPSETSYSNEQNKIEYKFNLNQIIILKEDISCIFHNNEETREYEKNLLYYLKIKKFRVTFYLKKPINNQETGYIKNIIYYEKNKGNNKNIDESFIILENIYGIELKIELKTIEILIFADDSIIIQIKDKMSFADKIFKKIQKRMNPSSILYL